MLIIDDKIVIIHIRKAGGTSFCKGLLRLLPADRMVAFGYAKRNGGAKPGAPRPAIPPGQTRPARTPGSLWKHSTAADFVASRGGQKGDYRLILVSARPLVERVVSFYFYCRRANKRDPEHYKWVENMTFPAYLAAHIYDDTLHGFATAASGEVLVDHIVDYRNLNGAYTALCAERGFPGQSIPRLNAAPEKKRDYAVLFRPRNLARIQETLDEEEAFLARAAHLIA